MKFKITKKNFPLIVGLSIPLLMVILVTASIYIPAIGEKPTIDFIYSIGNYYGDYIVKNGKIQKKELTEQQKKYRGNQVSNLYYYDVSKSTAREITFEEAQVYKLDNRYTSEDGFKTERSSYHGGVFEFFVGGSSRYNTIYLSKGAYHKRLNIDSHYYNYRFLGWIKE